MVVHLHCISVFSASASFGRVEQDTELLAYTTNENLDSPLPRSSLDGEIDTANFAASFSSRISDKGNVRLSYRFDERDNKTAQDAWSRVIVDSFPTTDAELNIPYSFKRWHLGIRGDYDLQDAIRVSAGFDRRSMEREFQEVRDQDEDTGWVRTRLRPGATVELDVGGGIARRDVETYDEAGLDQLIAEVQS